MCNATPDQMQMLEKTVKQFLDEGRMFTAYDVTIETREREDINMRHKDVRGACHEIQCLSDACDFGWDDANGSPIDWSRSQVSMSGGGQWAFVYHPANVDPNGYTPRQTSGQTSKPSSQPSQSASTTPSISVTPSDSGGTNVDGTFATDYRNRLFIPTTFLRQAGLSPGDKAFVVADKPNKLVLLAGDDTNFKDDKTVRVTTQRVERNGDLRLSSTTLNAADLDADKFVIENTDKDGTACVQVEVAD